MAQLPAYLADMQREIERYGREYGLDFWDIEWRHWDLMFTGGLRATAYASVLAAPMMIQAGRGLIVNMTWVLDRPHGHAFYEVVKNATNS